MDEVRNRDVSDASPLGSDAYPGAREGGTEAPPYLLILSHIRFLREGLAEVLARDGVFAIAGVAANLDEAIAVLRAAPVGIALIDAALPEGLSAARCLAARCPTTPLVALALAETEANVLAWAQAGISGYIPRTAALSDLAGFLRDIVRGEQTCSARIAGGLLRWIARAAGAGISAPVLTAREEQVVRLICVGATNKEISRRLHIGLTTTKSHVHNLLAKLELERRGEVALWSRQHAWALRETISEVA